MSTTRFAFAAKLKIADEIVPLASEFVTGDSSAQDGVDNGFLFKLDLQPGEPPVVVNLGGIIDFVETKLGAGSGSLAQNPGLGTVVQAMPDTVTPATFNAQSGMLVDIRSFEVNSTTAQFLFSISVDIEGADPTVGLIALPPQLASWLRIDSLAIAFTATGTA